MNVLMISGDRNILLPGSAAHERLELERAEVDRLDVFVFPQVNSWHEICSVSKGISYDVVTAQDPFFRGLLAWHIARRTKAKLNLQVHTDLSAQPLWRRRLAIFLLRRADTVRVVSEEIKNYLAPLHLRAAVSVLPIYIDLTPFKNLQHWPHPRFKKTILWIGRFEPEKNPLMALSILKQVRNSGIDAGLILLGTGSLEAALRDRAKENAAHIEFPGWQSPVSYLAMADVVISTSKHESYGASIIEALAAGVPVVAPNVGIVAEAGAVVAPASGLAQTVMQVLRTGVRGKLKISLLSAQEWAKRWRDTLV